MTFVSQEKCAGCGMPKHQCLCQTEKAVIDTGNELVSFTIQKFTRKEILDDFEKVETVNYLMDCPESWSIEGFMTFLKEIDLYFKK